MILYFVLYAIFFYCMYFTSSILSLIFKARVMCLNPSLILVFVCAKLLIIMEIGQFLLRLSNKVERCDAEMRLNKWTVVGEGGQPNDHFIT